MEIQCKSEGKTSRLHRNEINCPACNRALKVEDIKNHYEMEVVRVLKYKLTEESLQVEKNNISESARQVFQKVRDNRNSRLQARSRKQTLQTNTCPICNAQADGDINRHVEECLRNIENGSDESIDIEGETYEEYEWAGQKRVRTSSFLQGGYASIGVGTLIVNKSEEDDEDLNVDEDDSEVYGPSQYSESDVNAMSEKSTNRSYHGDDCENTFDKKTKEVSTCSCTSKDHVINALKTKIQDFESQICNKIKCLICLGEFRNPAVSISCWHVHCEKCWLRTIGTRKLCPQCNVITSPTDLRRIYM